MNCMLKKKNMNNPLLSIVIANYNYGSFIEAAIQSVISQDAGDLVELIVCDGGSTDNSVEIIRKYSDRISWWVSERDDGQSDAFNKGFEHAHGKYLTWLNADDIMPKGCLRKVLREFCRNPSCEWFTANAFMFNNESRKVVEIDWGPHWYPECLQHKNSPIVAFGPSTFFAKSLWRRVGGVDVNMHYVMDNDLWLRFMAAGVKQRRINCFCWAFRMHVGSKTAEFDSHQLDVETKSKLYAERVRANAKVGYKMSKALRIACLLMRILDGSIFRGFVTRCLFRSVNFDNVR